MLHTLGVFLLFGRFILLTESLPRKERLTAQRGDKEMAVTSLSFSPNDETTFLVGSDSGGVFKCSTNTKGTPASREWLFYLFNLETRQLSPSMSDDKYYYYKERVEE